MALKTLSAAALAVASGPGEVEVTFLDHDGFFVRHSSSDGSTLVNWNPWPKNTVAFLALNTNQYLHIRGRGTAYVEAVSGVEI